MNMSRCVPRWDFMENNSVSPKTPEKLHPISESAVRVLKLDSEAVTELTWKNGQPGMTVPAAWDGPRAGGTLESIVDQATKSGADGGRVPLLDPRSVAVATDAMVPCNNGISSNNNSSNNILYKNSASQLGCGTCGVGSCSGARPEACRCGAASDSATFGAAGRESHLVTGDSDNYREREFGAGASWSTSLFSPENTSSAGGEYARTSPEDHDSFCRSRSQRDGGGGDGQKRKGGNAKPLSVSSKSRAAAIHNRSERKRRDKINQKMKTLQRMVPNASKTDKASMLDEVIEYLKQLQAQVQFMMSRMNMMLPSLAMQQQLQMSMMGMGMGHVMDMGTMRIPPFIPASGGFLPSIPSWEIQGGNRPNVPMPPPDMLSAFLACHQSQPLTIDAYSKLQAALYQQLQQPPAPDSKN